MSLYHQRVPHQTIKLEFRVWKVAKETCQLFGVRRWQFEFRIGSHRWGSV